MRNEQTQELITEINSQSTNSISGYKIIKGGTDLTIRGYWVCEELALAYATWISPKFHLVVLRAFIAMHKGEVQTIQPKHSTTLTKWVQNSANTPPHWQIPLTAQSGAITYTTCITLPNKPLLTLNASYKASKNE